jgi:hypothetical protein
MFHKIKVLWVMCLVLTLSPEKRQLFMQYAQAVAGGGEQ